MAYIIEENFEGTGYEGSWTEAGSGTIDEDYTTSPLAGSHSLRIVGVGGTGSYTYIVNSPDGLGGLSEYFGYFMLRADAVSGSNDVECFSIAVNGVSDEMRIIPRSGSGWKISNGSVTSGYDNTVTVTAGGTYHIWWQYKKSTGANGISRLWVSTTGTKPGSHTVEVTNGNSTSTVNVISPRAISSDCAFVFDKVLLSATVLGDNGSQGGGATSILRQMMQYHG